MDEYTKPLPIPDLDTEPFWQFCKAHELRAQRCARCGKMRWPPQGVCRDCHCWDFEWVKLDGTGRVYSYVVVHHVVLPAFSNDAPYVIAQILLDGTEDRVRITSNIIGCPWEQVKVGMRVRALFEDVTPGVALPKFRPDV